MASQYDYVKLPVVSAITEAAFSGDRLAVACRSPGSGAVMIQVWQAKNEDNWEINNIWQVDDDVALLAWADPENGRLLAACTSGGSISVWEAPSTLLQTGSADAQDDSMQQDDDGAPVRAYRPAGRLKCSSAPIRALAFAPTQHGLILAAASQDGHVYIHEADRVLSPTSWVLLSKFQAGIERAAPCACLVWRPFSLGVPPMLAAGAGSFTCLWQYSASYLKWQRVATLKATSGPVGLDWAKSMGRAHELLAVANGSAADVHMLSHGGGDGSAVQAELHASLAHPSVVWKVQFDALGTALAVGTGEMQDVVVWRPNLLGEWQTLALLKGTDALDLDADTIEEQ